MIETVRCRTIAAEVGVPGFEHVCLCVRQLYDVTADVTLAYTGSYSSDIARSPYGLHSCEYVEVRLLIAVASVRCCSSICSSCVPLRSSNLLLRCELSGCFHHEAFILIYERSVYFAKRIHAHIHVLIRTKASDTAVHNFHSYLTLFGATEHTCTQQVGCPQAVFLFPHRQRHLLLLLSAINLQFMQPDAAPQRGCTDNFRRLCTSRILQRPFTPSYQLISPTPFGIGQSISSWDAHPIRLLGFGRTHNLYTTQRSAAASIIRSLYKEGPGRLSSFSLCGRTITVI